MTAQPVAGSGSDSGRRRRRRRPSARPPAGPTWVDARSGAAGGGPGSSSPSSIDPEAQPAPGTALLEDVSRDRPLPAFAHASEAEMARILDYYRIAWEYEPHTFPILWNLEGTVVESFSPDFWLPDLDLYLEMTTLRQKLVRKKNRKLRRLRELYPDLRIKLFYARDFRALMLKFGRLALVDALSGTPGQVLPDRPVAPRGLAVDDITASALGAELGDAP